MAASAYATLLPGDTAPWFSQRSTSNPRFVFDTAGGRYIVLCFLGTGSDAHAQAAIAAARSRPQFFDDTTGAFFAVTSDPADEAQGRLKEHLPGHRVFWDFDGAIGMLYGALPRDFQPAAKVSARRFWAVLDPTLRVMNVIPSPPTAPTSRHSSTTSTVFRQRGSSRASNCRPRSWCCPMSSNPSCASV